jgi:hypothetical protein
MKRLGVVLLTLMGAVSLALAVDSALEHHLDSSNQEVRAGELKVKKSRMDYLSTAQRAGPTSPETVSAKTRLDADRRDLQSKRLARRALRQQARAQILEHHAEHHNHPK